MINTSVSSSGFFFNDALNTFYLRLYGVRHMVKDHSNSKRGNPCRHTGYSLRLAARVILYASSHRHDNTYHGLCYTSREIAQWVHHVGSIQRPIASWANALTTELHFGSPLREGRKEMFYLTTHSTHFIYGYMASGKW